MQINQVLIEMKLCFNVYLVFKKVTAVNNLSIIVSFFSLSYVLMCRSVTMCEVAAEIIRAFGYRTKVFRLLNNDDWTTLDQYATYDVPRIPVPWNLQMPKKVEKLKLSEPFTSVIYP